MNIKLSNSKWGIPGLILLLILLLVGAYFLLVYPKIGVIDRKESELNTQQQILATLESGIGKSNDTAMESTTTLQKQVPVKPLAQQLLLVIEKAEVVSNSFVSSMNFSDAEVTIEAPLEENEATDETNDVDNEALNEEADRAETEGQQENTGEGEPQQPFLPQGIKKITISLNVESPSYYEMESFIHTLENNKRIMVIESIDFTANEEIIELEQVDKPLSYGVTVSAFYMPTLTDLIDGLPKVDSPEPAEKKNPFSNFADYTGSIVNFNPLPPNQPFKNNGEDVIHVVQPGDTLFDLAIHYYNSKSGIQKIKDENGIVGHLIFTGQKLVIPFEDSDGD